MKKRIIAWAVLLSVCAAALGLWCSAAAGKGDVWRTVKMVIIASPRSTRGLTPRISMRTLYKSHNTEMSDKSVSSSSV